MGHTGGVDLGGTKIQTVVVDGRLKVAGERGGPRRRRAARRRREPRSPARARRRCAGRRRDRLPAGIGIGSPGEVDDDPGTVRAPNLPGWEGTSPARRAREAFGTPRRARQRRPGRDRRRVRARRRAAVPARCWGSSGAPASAAGSCSTASPGRPRRGGRDRPRGRAQGGALCACGRRGCMEAYAGRAAMERRARRAPTAAEDQAVQDHGGARAHATDQRRVGAGARPRRHARPTPGRPRGPRARRRRGLAHNVLDIEAVVIGGGLGLRLGEPYVDRIADAMMPHLFAETARRPSIAALGDLGGASARRCSSRARPRPRDPIRGEPALSRRGLRPAAARRAGGRGRRAAAARPAGLRRGGRRHADRPRHPVAARSADGGEPLDAGPPADALPARARGAAVGRPAAGGPVYGWAAFGGVASHLLRDAGDTKRHPAAWPWAPARQIGAAWATAGSAALALGSWAVSRVAAAP